MMGPERGDVMDMGTLLDEVEPLLAYAWVPATALTALLLAFMLSMMFHSPGLAEPVRAARTAAASRPAATALGALLGIACAGALLWCIIQVAVSPGAEYRKAFEAAYGFPPAVSLAELERAAGGPVFAEDDGTPVMYRVSGGRLDVFTEEGPVAPRTL